MAAWAVVFLAGSGAVTALVFGGYPPFYRLFLQAPRLPQYAEYVDGLKGIERVAKINDSLYRGPDPRGRLDELRTLGIRSLINFRYLKRNDYRSEAEAAGFNYFWIPILPSEPPTRAEIERFLAIVNEPANQPVYMHCTLGIDRTGLMAGIYRIEHDNWDNDTAVAEMEYFGHNELWMDLEDALRNYRPVNDKGLTAPP